MNNPLNRLDLSTGRNSGTASHVRWRILALLVFASFVSYVLRYNISTAGPTLVNELGLSEQQLGWIFAAFTIGYATFQFPGGLAVVKFGARRVLTFVMVMWALLTIATGLVPAEGSASVTMTIVLLMSIRVLVGIFHAPIYPTTSGVVERWFPPEGRALPNGLSSAGLTLGIAATAPVLSWLIIQYGWRASFMMFAPLAFVSAALWWWYSRDEPGDHGGVNQKELELIGVDHKSADYESEKAWWKVLENPNVLLLMVSYFCMNYVFYQMFNWVYYYLVNVREIDGGQAGLLNSRLWIMGAVGAVAGGFLCDWLCRRWGLRLGCRIPAVFGLSAAAIFMMIGALSINPMVAVTALACCFLFHQMTEGAYWAAVINVGGRQAAAAAGVMNTGGNLVGFVNALLVPYISTMLGWTAALASAAGFAAVAAVLWLFIDAENKTTA